MTIMTLKNKLNSDIDELINNLRFLKEFIDSNITESNEIEFFTKINTIVTEIQLLKNKLKPKK